MEQAKKKPTNAQLQRRIDTAVLHIDKTKDTKNVYFDDKGMRLIVDNDYAIIETNYHRHVFSAFTNSGYSRPYMYTKRFVELALENDCIVRDAKGNPQGYSYALLLQVLKDKEDKAEYNVAMYFDWWSFSIFNNLYSIDNNAASQWFVYFNYMHNIAVNAIVLDERKEDLTTKSFFDKYVEMMREFVDGIDEYVILSKPKEGEENAREIAEAENDTDMERAMQDVILGDDDGK